MTYFHAAFNNNTSLRKNSQFFTSSKMTRQKKGYYTIRAVLCKWRKIGYSRLSTCTLLISSVKAKMARMRGRHLLPFCLWRAHAPDSSQAALFHFGIVSHAHQSYRYISNIKRIILNRNRTDKQSTDSIREIVGSSPSGCTKLAGIFVVSVKL